MTDELYNFLVKFCEKYALECIYPNSIAYILDVPIDLKRFSSSSEKFVTLMSYEQFPESFLEFFLDNGNEQYLLYILKNQKVSERFIEKYIKIINSESMWERICDHQELTEDFLEKHIDNGNEKILVYVLRCKKVSEKFLEKYIEFINTYSIWMTICVYQELSNNFLEKYKDNIVWAMISQHQTLSEEFMEKYQDKIDWSKISLSQKFSDSFIKKFLVKINFNNLKCNKNKEMRNLLHDIQFGNKLPTYW